MGSEMCIRDRFQLLHLVEEQTTGNLYQKATTTTTFEFETTSTELNPITTTEGANRSSPLTSFEIGGIAAAGSLLVLLVLLGICVCLCFYRRKRAEKRIQAEKQHIVNQFALE